MLAVVTTKLFDGAVFKRKMPGVDVVLGCRLQPQLSWYAGEMQFLVVFLEDSRSHTMNEIHVKMMTIHNVLPFYQTSLLKHCQF